MAMATGSAIRPRPANEASSRRRRTLEHCRNAHAGGKRRHAIAAGPRYHGAQCRAEGASHAGANHADAPQHEGNRAEQGQKKIAAVHSSITPYGAAN
jgi:hypothetical protein